MESGAVSIPLELELGRDCIRSWRAENDVIVAGCANDLCLQKLPDLLSTGNKEESSLPL